MTIRKRKRGLLTRFSLILFGVFVGALIGEIALRLAGYSFPEFYQVDLSRGYALRPGIEGWYRKEGEAYVRINSDGLRDVEHAKQKPRDTIRIVVLGDSYAEAFQVSQEQAFWSVMERQLQSCGSLHGNDSNMTTPVPRRPASDHPNVSSRPPDDRTTDMKIEVLNFGVSGYSTAQQLITLREQVWTYSPDLVLLTVTTNNDIADNSRALKRTDEIPYFMSRDGQIVLDDSFKSSRAFRLRQSFISRLGRWLKDHLRLVQAINEGHRGLKVLLASLKERWKSSESASGSETALRNEELGIDNLIYSAPTSLVWSEAWNITEHLIKQMNDEVKARGARFVVITLSNPPQVVPSPKSREAFMERTGVNELFYPDNRIRLFAEREGITVITLAPELQAYAEQKNIFLHGFGSNIGNGHWNVEGHRAAGELIAGKLCY